MARAIILVVDGFGIGSAPDAADFNDIGANTFTHIAEKFYEAKGTKLALPNLAKLGLYSAGFEASGEHALCEPQEATSGAYGCAAEISTGKDTPSGHWEMMGVPVLFDWGYFKEKEFSFPQELLDKVYQATGIDGCLGQCHASGTQIIAELGEKSMQTGLPICYTSADSVFQVAAHEESFGLDNLYTYCEQVREVLEGLNIGRVIARPFVGNNAEDFSRTGNRRDYSILPPSPTALDKLKAQGNEVISIGKIADIYAHQGITAKTKATGIDALMDATLDHIASAKEGSLIFTNLVNFDQDFGHRRDPVGYGEALENFDKRLPEVYRAMSDDDYLFITSDHGCDPTWTGTDHTREYVPVLAYKKGMSSVNLGKRSTFADLGQTIADLFKTEPLEYGTSFLNDLK